MFDKRGEPIIHVDWYILTKDLKLPANRRNNSWPHVQQGVQTDPKMLRPFASDFLNVYPRLTMMGVLRPFAPSLPLMNTKLFTFVTKLWFDLIFWEINSTVPLGVLILRLCRLLFTTFVSNLELVYPCAGFIPSLRPDCGYYGIQKEECLRRLCCWDDTIQNVPWCFKNSKKNESL